jgi:ABC-type nitrate/sulfonate/bicarbonate transport system permease component
VFFPTAIATYASIDAVPRNIIRMSQVFGVPMMSIVFKTLLPGSLPGILSGMRISIATALLLVVAAEMIGAENGIGAFVMLAGNLMRSDQLLAGVVVISILGLLIGVVLSALEKSLFRWR